VADQNEQQHQEGEQTAQISGTVQIKQQGSQPQGGAAKPEEQKEEEPPAKKTRRKLIIIVVVVLLALIAIFFYWRSTYTEDTDDAQVDGNLYQVSARVSGQVVHVDVEEQQLVHAGDPIAEIDPKDYQVAMEQAQASLAAAQAQYEQAKVNVPITSVSVETSLSTSGSDVLGGEASVSQSEAQAQASRARVQAAKATALKSQLDVDRYTPLVAKDVISKQQYDAAVAQATADQAALDEAERNVKAQQDNVRMMQQRLASSQSQEQQNRANGPKQVAQAKVDQAQLNMSYTKVVAPIDGIVSKKSVAVGENLSVGQSLMTIVPLTDLWVTANFKETQLKQMKTGQEVKLEVDALGGRKFTGRVQQIGGATGSSLSLFPPENATGNYVKVVQRIPVRINFTNLDKENKDLALRIGMSVTPTVTVKK
jgi:membrane fusion protein (multidrug efflux system)